MPGEVSERGSATSNRLNSFAREIFIAFQLPLGTEAAQILQLEVLGIQLVGLGFFVCLKREKKIFQNIGLSHRVLGLQETLKII